MENTLEKTVGEIVAENYKAADIFKKHGIDFCCGGNIGLSDLCEKKKLDFNQISHELEQLNQPIQEENDYNNWTLDRLIQHIVEHHHSYVLENIPIILQYADKVARVHGEYHPETVQVNELFRAVAQELMMHMQKEEQILFPFIQELVQAEKEGKSTPGAQFGTVQNPIRMMEHEHEDAGDIFKEISAYTNQYTPPEEACNTYRVLYAKLNEFEQDLHQHIHLENNILHPKAIALEASFK